MSWLSTKPPWATVQWLNWGDPHKVLWTQAPSLTISTGHASTPINNTLYKYKQVIENLDASGEWEFLKRSSNPYELVYSQSQDPRIPQSIANLRPLSRSFFKMVEILNILDFFPRHKSNIQSAHVCEGPGGFIEALIYQSSKASVTVDHAYAMTLKPTKANIPGWRRAHNFLSKSPMVHIEYGADETGNILVPENQAAFLKQTQSKCSIFTADGGFDFSEHYSMQEEHVFPLLVSSSLIGLQTMNMGGDFVLKLFDTELKCTTDLIAMLAYCFDSWTLYKPGLSRPCNAEKYFLGKGCRVVPAWILRTLSELRDGFTEGTHVESIFNIIPKHIENDIAFLKQEYLDQQIAALDYAIKNKEKWNENPYRIWKAICGQSANWCSYFHIPLKYSVESIRV
jgi:23S rRNA U2552 (ribose-2'-O)-methylase RlmE/FtsJ